MDAGMVLITGAGSGLGRALAQRFAAIGQRVACVDLDLASAEQTCAALPGQGHAAFHVDVGDDASMAQLKAALDARGEAVSILINNAGIASGGSMLEAGMVEWQRLLNINLLGVVRGCRAFLPAMLAARRGQIVNVASFAAMAAAPGIMTYGVAKAGVLALSEQLRAETHGSGVHVSVICPAFFATRLLDRWEGSTAAHGIAQRLMREAPDSLDSVADACFAGIRRADFLILPTRREPMRWRLKRWFPNLYFRQLLKLAATRASERSR